MSDERDIAVFEILPFKDWVFKARRIKNLGKRDDKEWFFYRNLPMGVMCYDCESKMHIYDAYFGRISDHDNIILCEKCAQKRQNS